MLLLLWAGVVLARATVGNALVLEGSLFVLENVAPTGISALTVHDSFFLREASGRRVVAGGLGKVLAPADSAQGLQRFRALIG